MGGVTDITVWSLPDCQGCRLTVALFKKLGVEVSVQDLSTDPERAADFRGRGLLSAPVVETADLVWSGFRPEVVRQVAAGLSGEGL